MNFNAVSQNVIVNDAKIHNDASVDISSDGRFLVTFLPARMVNLFLNTLSKIRSRLYNFFVKLSRASALASGYSVCTLHLNVA